MNVTFNGITKIITVNTGVTTLDVKIDLYSDWKEWSLIDDNSKYLSAMRSVGGDPISDVKKLGATYFLTNGWRIRPAEWNHRLTVVGNLYTEEGESPYLSVLGPYSVMVINEVSTLVESTIAQLSEIEYTTFAGGVYINALSSTVGTAYPSGTPSDPVNNLTDALSIAVTRGLTNLYFIGNFTFSNSVYISNYNLIGEGMQKSTFTFQNGSIVAYCKAYNAKLTGQVLGIVGFENCHLYNYSSSGLVPSSNTVIATKCLIDGTLSLPSNFTGNIVSLDCWSGKIGTDPPILDMNGAHSNILLRNYSGGIELDNYSYSSGNVSIDLISGNVVLTSGVTNGTISIKGVGTLEDNSTGTTIVNIDGLISKVAVADAVHEEIGTEIEYSSYNGGITIDVVNGTDSSEYPYGTPAHPCKTIANCFVIGTERGFNTLYVIGDITISYSDVPYFVGGTIIGQGTKNTTITLDNTIVIKSVAKNCKVVGTAGNGSEVELHDCEIGDFYNISLNAFDCILSGTIELNDTVSSNFFNCSDGIPGSGTPSILVNDCETLGFWNYNGGLSLKNITGATDISVNFNTGRLILNSTCTNGTIIVRGIGSLVDGSAGTTINKVGLVDNASMAFYSWDEILANHPITGTTGKALSTASTGGVDIQLLVNGVWNEQLSAHTYIGSAGNSLKSLTGITNDISSINNSLTGITSSLSGLTYNMDKLSQNVISILGLVQHNFRFAEQIYNASGNLTSGVITTYASAADCEAGDNPLSEYRISALYDTNDRLIDYKVKLV